MKIPERLQVPIVVVLIVIVYALIFWPLLGAKPKPAPGVCIYEVITNQLINLVSIGWTSAPCQDLDVRIPEERAKLTRSNFKPICPVFAVQAWPELYLPVIDYADDCALNFIPRDREADDEKVDGTN